MGHGRASTPCHLPRAPRLGTAVPGPQGLPRSPDRCGDGPGLRPGQPAWRAAPAGPSAARCRWAQVGPFQGSYLGAPPRQPAGASRLPKRVPRSPSRPGQHWAHPEITPEALPVCVPPLARWLGGLGSPGTGCRPPWQPGFQGKERPYLQGACNPITRASGACGDRAGGPPVSWHRKSEPASPSCGQPGPTVHRW